MVELFSVSIGQRVLIFGLRQAAADSDVLPSLHEEFCTRDLGHFRAQALDNLSAPTRDARSAA